MGEQKSCLSTKDRAVLYIRRKKRQSRILFLIFFLISVLFLCCSSMGKSSKGLLVQLKDRFPAEVSLYPKDNAAITEDMVERIKSEVHPLSYNTLNVYYLYSDEIKPVPGYFAGTGKKSAHIIRYLACRDTALAKEFKLKKFKLKEGKHLVSTDQGKVLISDVLAKQNNLSVGDEFEAEITDDVVSHAKQGFGKSYLFEIAGIYSLENKVEGGDGNTAECDRLDNYIYTDEQTGLTILAEMMGWTEKNYKNTVSFQLKSPDVMADAAKAIKALPEYDGDKYEVRTEDREYQETAKPLKRMIQVVDILMKAVFIVGGMILSIVLFLWNRERIRETGIYLSAGISKKEVLFQYLLENGVLSLVAFFISVPCSFLVLGVGKYFFKIQGTMLHIATITKVFSLVFVLCLLSTLASSYFVMGFSPKKILTKMS